MSSVRNNGLLSGCHGISLGLMASLASSMLLLGQPTGNSPSTQPMPGSGSAVHPGPKPALPGATTPADEFRGLLAMTPERRAEALADRTEVQRKELETRLAEFEALQPDERETRLKQLALRCHLLGLMKLSPVNRRQRLELIPADLRPLIENRLQEWDRLPPALQREVMEYETTANYFLRLKPEDAPAPPEDGQPNRVPAPADWDRGRPRIAESLNRFLQLPVKDQERALEGLSATERQELSRTLQLFAGMTPAQRQTCLQSFDKFSRMTKEERNQFLRNAERWKSMTPRERETWRNLIEIVPPGSPASVPPTPPGFGQMHVSTGGAPSVPGMGKR